MAPHARKRILIVEDDEALARVVKMRLQSVGYEARAESLGKKALGYAAAFRPDLVILDINLPDCSGYQVARELRRIFHPWPVPVLMLTVKNQPADQLRGFAFGADAYLTKPFDSSELFETVALLTQEPAAA
ncbi:MAG TPA: response regulator [bacterium]